MKFPPWDKTVVFYRRWEIPTKLGYAKKIINPKIANVLKLLLFFFPKALLMEREPAKVTPPWAEAWLKQHCCNWYSQARALDLCLRPPGTGAGRFQPWVHLWNTSLEWGWANPDGNFPSQGHPHPPGISGDVCHPSILLLPKAQSADFSRSPTQTHLISTQIPPCNLL